VKAYTSKVIEEILSFGTLAIEFTAAIFPIQSWQVLCKVSIKAKTPADVIRQRGAIFQFLKVNKTANERKF
jgi:hypothetical protein